MISSRQNSRIKSIRRLADCRDEFALLEGPHLVAESLESPVELVEVLMTQEFSDSSTGQALAARLGSEMLMVSDAVLASVADAGSPQGVLAIARLPRTGVESLPVARDGVYLFIDRVQDPGNLGALVRSAEATGAAGVALSSGCAHANHPKALRASAGSLLRLPTALGAGIGDLVSRLSAVSPTLVVLDSSGGESLDDCELGGTLILAVGSEAGGPSRELLEAASLRLTIPLAAPVESLNAAVAAGVVLNEIARRRRSRARGPIDPASSELPGSR